MCCQCGRPWRYKLTDAVQGQLAELMDLMRLFIAPVYTCSASAANWEVGESFDDVSREVRRNGQSAGHFCPEWTEVLGVPPPVQVNI
jgi:hypothetical protein